MERPDPDQLLREVLSEEENDTHPVGRLKIFFGYAAGVGKTFTMLEAAHAALNAGIDVVAGYIEPHTRPETLALLNGLPQIPPKELVYKGITLREFDLDSALERHPELLLVDELAHTNAEGSRHRKRYQDIEELLRAGIDVYTTVNVQHLESLNDIVASITGVTVQERLPDSVFDRADQVELVDIEPDDLIARLNQGKIYRATQARKALDHFFVPENLIALREIALRRTADRVNRKAERAAPTGSRYAEEHILCCLSSAPSNARVIRAAARMAEAFHGTLIALFVETPDTPELSGENRSRLRANLKLAEDLGAQIATVYGEPIADQIAEYAKAGGISKIVIGRSNNKKRWFIAGINLVNQLIELAPNLDIYIIPDHQPPYRKKRKNTRSEVRFSLPDTLKAVGILTIVSLIGLWFYFLGFSEANIITLYLLGVLLTSMVTTGWVYSAASSILGVLVFNFLFTDPRYSLEAYDAGYPVTFLVMLVASLLVSSLTRRLKAQGQQAAREAYNTQILLETNQKLQQSGSQEEIFRVTALQMQKLLKRVIVFYPVHSAVLSLDSARSTGRNPDMQGTPSSAMENQVLGEPLVFTLEDDSDAQIYTAPDERAVAQWVLKNNKHAGAGTNTLPGAKCLYLAVRGHDNVYAVASAAMGDGGNLEAFQKNLLLAILGECGLALEKAAMQKAKREVEMQARQEQLRSNLLRAISHDLRTPLTSISGNAGILMGNSDVLDEEKRQTLYGDIYDDSMWLINLVENLLSVTRIENGTMNIRSEAELLDEVFHEALSHLNRKSNEHEITVNLSEEFLMAQMDARLIIQVIINIVDNAIKYTPKGSHIRLSGRRDGSRAIIEISDDGPGIPDESKAKLFDMFYTADNTSGDGRRGLGLGLSLCKSIITAHGGKIGVRDNPPHGTLFYFTLKSEEVRTHE